ncbi:MAG: DUF4974 domain-containing protein [Draconibacterium sp.]
MEKKIKDFLAGRLSQPEEKKLLNWIKASEENKRHFLNIQEILGDTLKERSVMAGKWSTMMRLITPPSLSKVPSRTLAERVKKFTLPVAAALIIGFFIGGFLFKGKTGSVAPVAEQTIVTPWGARTRFVLPDSSLVWLNSGSKIVFPEQFNGVREVKLSGEAYFEVEKNGDPFIVSTNLGKVQVMGTTFNVKAIDGEDFETTLVSGKVQVVNPNNKLATLEPGYQAVFSGDNVSVEKVETVLYTSWIEGKLIFREEYLPELVKKLERFYNVKIDLDDDPRLKRIHYSGTIEMETFSEVLNLLSVTAPIAYTWNEKTRVIKLFYKKENGIKL